MPNLVSDADLPQNLRTLVQRADQAIQVQNFGYAVQLLLPVVKAEPNFLDGRIKLRKAAGANKKAAGKKLFSLGGGFMKVQSKVKKEPASAIPELEDLLVDDPYSAQGNNLLFEAAEALGMTETAAFALETIRDGNPSDTKIMHRLAHFYMEHGEPEKAGRTYEAILKVDPTDGEARKGVTNANARASIVRQGWGSDKNVRDLLRNKDQSQSLEADSKKGMTREQLEERLTEWGNKYNEDPQNLTTAKRIAEIYEQLEDFDSAYKWFEYAYSLSNGDVSLQAKVQHLHDKLDEIHIHQLQEALNADPHAPDAAEKEAELTALRRARVDKQVAVARERVEKNPPDPQYRFDLGVALFSSGNFSDAIPELQRAKNNPHIRSKAMLTLARCYEAKGINDLAVRQLDECSAELTGMDGVKKEVLYTKGLIHEKMGQKAEALEAFKQIYEADYGYMDVAQRVESSYS